MRGCIGLCVATTGFGPGQRQKSIELMGLTYFFLTNPVITGIIAYCFNSDIIFNILKDEVVSKRFSLVKVKAGDNFNRRNTRSISRIEI
jgi:hypothetical protein